MLFRSALYRSGSNVQDAALGGEGMNRKLKTIFGKTEKLPTILKKLLHARALTKCAVIVAACACSPFARGQSAMPVQTALTVESPQEMQARISKLEAEVAELKAIAPI